MVFQIPGTDVFLKPVSKSLFKFPPANIPAVIPPPSDHPTLSHPFTIPTSIYNAALSPTVPITIALVYATTVTLLNRFNAKHGNKPWAISKTRGFHIFVVAHNVFLAVYSAWTFVGMLYAMRTSVPSPRAEGGLPGFVDGLCKIHGPRGLGSAATFNTTTDAWSIANRALHLGETGTPDATDVGRIWNEGLAFYGWIFYLSKFYEVLDTLIILAKGKRSSTLQTYHHAGAMMCMWAGIRYMAPPIWMFCFVNSLIHAMMYTYYTLAAVGVKVPVRVKRTLTTLQIMQFVVGTTFAFAHLFIAYKVPISVPYIFSTADLTSIPADAASTVSSVVATASAGLGSWAKKLALRAAGVEGAAENVENEVGQTFGIDAVHAAQDLKAREEIRYRDELRLIHCTDTSGEVFAILLNCFYLLPLTALFVRFFIKSYLNRVRRNSMASTGHVANQARIDATKGAERTLTDELGGMHGSDEPVFDEPTVSPSAEAKEKLKELKKKVNEAKEDTKATLKDVKEKEKTAK